MLMRSGVLFLVCVCVGDELVREGKIGGLKSARGTKGGYEELYPPDQGAKLYDAYFGKPLSNRRRSFLNNVINASIVNNNVDETTVNNIVNNVVNLVNASTLCTVRVEPCDEHEGRRVDGTCVNPKYPSRGATISPFLRLLPPMFGLCYEISNSLRSAKDGSELPSTRILRTSLLADGFITNHEFTSLITHVFVFSFVDNADLVYLLRYIALSDCCLNNQIPNELNPRCIPIRVPGDDPYLRRTGVRCLNLTRVETYQDYGCAPRSLPVERYNRVPPLLDLSVIYGNTAERGRAIRANQGGLLAFRMEGNREVPAGQAPICSMNRPPEVSCYNFGDNFQGNLLSGIYLTGMWFFREHNRIARKLAIINPCWDDEKLYQTARQINIAQYQFIYYYELVSHLMGQKRALADGIIHDTYGHVNDFNPENKPGVYREYVIGCRWFHTIQSGFSDLYRNHEYLGSRTVVDDNMRAGILAVNNTEADLTEGAINQPAENHDDVMHPDISERIFGELQTAADLPAIDMMRGRDAGLPPYNHYRKLCGMKEADKFEDFEDAIDKDKVETLRRLYDDVEDVELMVAIYAERLLPDSYVGPTLYCIMTRNLLNWRKSDRFFFEHDNFPGALTKEQLREVKSTSMARILCDSGDDIKMIQPRAFYRRRIWNDFVSCNEIRGMDLTKWDAQCPKPPPRK